MITDISQLGPNGTYTYADYLKWQLDKSVELVLEDGEYALVDVYESGEIPSCIFPDLLVSHDRIFR